MQTHQLESYPVSYTHLDVYKRQQQCHCGGALMIGGVLNLDQLFTAINETIYMTLVSLVLATILGLLIGILLYCTQTGGLFQNKIINRVIDVIINVLRAIPFIILLIILIPFTKLIVGTMLGATAALPLSLIHI